METNIAQQTPEVQKPTKTPLIKQTITYILIIALSMGGTLYITKLNEKGTNNNNDTPKEVKITQDQPELKDENWVMPKSNKKAYAYIERDNKELQLWNIETKQLEDTNIAPFYGGGAAGLGVFDPTTAPNLLYTIYRDNSTGELVLLSHENLEKKVISPKGAVVSYITGWSPNSRYVVYHVDKKTLVFDGMGMYEGIVKFDEQKYSGFMLFDTKTGTTKMLSPLSYVETFVGNNKLLVRPSFDSNNLAVFNFETFEADFDLIKEEYPFGALQFNISEDEKNWTYTYSKDPTNDANIVYGDFPSTKEEMEIIDSGVWAEVQWPLISPDGTKLIYQKRIGQKFSGLPLNQVHLVDLETGENEVLIEGSVKAWLDDTNILIYRTVRETSPTADVFMVDITTGTEYLVGNEF